ncbi:MAG: 50S ribosomal protein L9 [Lachnospiraceae bacterium]|nr:50S ribosomal protein L9 [Lachnospiraceae bacterium]
MKVILLEDVKKLGKKGDVVDVSDGYAKNFILHKKLGVVADAKSLNDLKLKKQNDDKVAAEKLANAKALAEELKDKKVVMKIKVGEGGKAFGSVSTKEIADEAKKQLGLELDKKKMTLPVPIKELGSYNVQIKLHAKVTAELKVEVESL